MVNFDLPIVKINIYIKISTKIYSHPILCVIQNSIPTVHNNVLQERGHAKF
jgi:hypothetical protein